MRRIHVQLIAVLLCAYALKFHYSTASVDQLRWILAPTTFLVELLSGREFAFESHAGYMSADHTFLIAASCAGANFLLTAFLMLTLRKLWTNRFEKLSWAFLPGAAVTAFIATIVANTMRISIALQLPRHRLNVGWLNSEQFHRLEGIAVYFAFLILLYVLSERFNAKTSENCQTQPRVISLSQWLTRSQLHFPLLIYYATTIGFPLVNGAYKRSGEFWEHSLFVLVTPMLLIASFAVLRFCRSSERYQ